MMDVAGIASRMIGAHGYAMTLRRRQSDGTYSTLPVVAIGTDYAPGQLPGGVDVADRRLWLRDDEPAASGWAAPASGDQISDTGKTYTLTGCRTYRDAGGVSVHLLFARGG